MKKSRQLVSFRHLLVVAAALLTSYFAASPADSATLTVQAQLQTYADDFSHIDSSSSATGPISASQTLNQTYTGGAIFDGSASAIADYGTLKAFASATLTDYSTSSYWTCHDNGTEIPDCYGGDPASAYAGFRDTLTIDNLPADGLLHSIFSIDRTVTSSSSLSVSNRVGVQGGTGISTVTDSAYFMDTGSDTVDLILPITSGVPLAYAASLSVLVYVNDVCTSTICNPLTSSGSALADFLNTVTLSEFLVTDLDNNPITGISIQSESGTNYAISALNTVPIPPALWFFGSGLLGLIGIARRKNAA